MKHMEHVKSILKHGIPFGALIKCLLTSMGIYEDGENPLVLGKPLDIKCLGHASFKFKKKEGVRSRVQRTIATTASREKEGEVLHLEGPGLEISTIDKVFVLLSSMIKHLSKNMNDH